METIAAITLIVLIILASVLVLQLGLIVRRSGKLVSQLERDLPSLINKADVAVDTLQEQLNRVETVVESAQNATLKVQSTAQGAQQMLSSPAAIVMGLIAGAGNSWRKRRRDSSDT